MRHILMRGVFYKKNPGYRSLSFKKVSFLVIRSFFILFCCTYCDGSCDGSSFERKDGGKRSPDSIGGSLSGQGDPDSVGVLINEGADYTRNNIVQLTFDPSEDADQMLISSKADCSGGTWESLKTNKLMELSHLNAENTVYVKYRFMGEEETQCVSDSIIHDNIRPEVSFVNPPGPWSPASLTINLNARDTGSGIDEIQCDKQSTGHFITCGSSVSYHSLQSGDHSLVIRARDKAGNLSVPKRVDWKVAVSKQVNHNIQPELPKVDILFIVDTSISMDREREQLAQKINGFISQISHLDWQIAATTTTVVSDAYGPNISPGKRIWSYNRRVYDRCLFDRDNSLPSGTSSLSYEDWSNTDNYSSSLPAYTMTSIYKVELPKSPTKNKCDDLLSDNNPYNYEHTEHSEGRLTDFTGSGNRILNSSIPNVQDVFGKRIQKKSSTNPMGFPMGDAREQGIHAAVKAIQRYVNNESSHTDFFREGASLAFIVLSDEDELSTAGMIRDKTTGGFITPHAKFATKEFYNDLTRQGEVPTVVSGSDFGRLYYNYLTGEALDTNHEVRFADNYIISRGDDSAMMNLMGTDGNSMCPQCPPEKFQNFVKSVFGSQKNMTWHSIIRTENNCSSDLDLALHVGYMYEALSNLTGVRPGDVCESDYTSQLQSIGGTVSGMSREITLDCEPVDINGDGRRDHGDVEVLFRTSSSSSYGVYPAGTYSVNGRKLVFSSDPNSGQYQVNYSCFP